MQKQTVLLLGYLDETTRIWAEAFQQRGLQVALTSSTTEVERAWREDPPMLTVVDASIPSAESLRLCRDLRRLGPAPILLVLTSASELIEAYQAGATECLIQPASPAVVLLKALAWSMRVRWAEVGTAQNPARESALYAAGVADVL